MSNDENENTYRYSAVQLNLFSLVGYPLYAWVCNNIQGQKLAGIFHNPHD